MNDQQTSSAQPKPTRNRWHSAIYAHLSCAAPEPQTPAQIWNAMQAAVFAHKSQNPRNTLGARIAELVASGTIANAGPRLYQLKTP
jgi:hypothetical protein